MLEETIYLVDGTSLCYRSFFAIKLSTREGFPTGAVYGFYQTLRKIISKYKPVYLGICFDVSRRTFRQEKFKQYKIQRPPSPEGLKVQIPLVKKLIRALGISIIEKEGFEADDIIASLCRKASDDGRSVVIISSDKDLYQLAALKGVAIYNYNKNKLSTRSDFIHEEGFAPELMVDYLGLAGDPTDNIPGARGIGRVWATRLVKEFGTVDNLFRNLDKVNQRIRGILKDQKKNILLSRELAELCFCDLESSWPDLKIRPPDEETMYKIFNELEFKAFLKDLPSPAPDLAIAVNAEIPVRRLAELSRDPLVFSTAKDEIFIFDPAEKCVYTSGLEKLKGILEDAAVKKVSYAFKSELLALRDINMRGIFFDVKIAGYLLDSSLADYSLSCLVSHYLGQHFPEIPHKFTPYFIHKLFVCLSDRLKKDGLWELFSKVEMPLIPVLSQMQTEGVAIDMEILNQLLEEVDKRIIKVKEKVFEAAGRPFNLNSPKQMGGVLFEELKIKPLKKTKTGYSTSEEVLEQLATQHPVAGLILEYRYLNKLNTTYLAPLIEEVEKNKGRLHTQFNQTKAQTGRLSSSSPNLQSIPVKGEFAQRLREAFIPSRPAGYLLSGDYSQIELRILAHLSGDEKLIEAFRNNRDIHCFTAGLLFGIREEEVDSAQRNIAKRVNFSIIYGMGPYGLSRELRISAVEAQNFIDDYFRRYPGIKDYIDKVKRRAQEEGFVSTVLGRRRILPDVNSPNVQLKEFSLRQAVNAPIQGSCADLIKVAMVGIDSELKKEGLATKLIMQIHDELIFDVTPGELEKVKPLLRKVMEGAIKLTVPVEVNVKSGKNWASLS